MASIKAIEGRSVHQIQSGQVIVDLCSVVKELAENSLDAGTTSIEVRLKNSGLDAIEVQDNGYGIAPEDFESIALKHYTSKLASYDDLANLNTFGFRGEALSSLCALSTFYVVTAQAKDGAKGTRLDFEISGKLKSKTVVAATKGTTVTVEDIFKNLPVRRKELERNIRREYQKVLNLLNAYACISVGVRFILSNTVAKGKRNVIFSTKANGSTRENIANVFSAKTLQSLLPLDLKFELEPSTFPGQSGRALSAQNEQGSREVQIVGHISRPVVGEGRSTADRQMFFVNSRPCALPQVAKAINEVYRSYNITQSPFIFANLKLDTNAYDVNVSPDKRTILLHDQNALLEALKSNLTELFDAHEQSVPQAQLSNKKFPVYKPLTITRQLPEDDITSKITAPTTRHSTASREEVEEVESSPVSDLDIPPASIVRKFAVRNTITREDADKRSKRLRPTIVNKVSVEEQQPAEDDRTEGTQLLNTAHSISTPVRDFNERLGVRTGTTDVNAHRENKNDCTESEEEDTTSSDEENPPLLGHDEAENAYASGKTAQASNEIARESHRKRSHHEDPIPSTSPNLKVANTGGLPNAFQRLRRPRASEDTATITIGNTTTVATLGTPSKRARIDVARVSGDPMTPANPVLLKSLRGFAAAGSQLGDVQMDDIDLISPQSDEVRTNDFHPIVPKLKKFPSAIILNSSDLVQAEDDEDDEDEGSEELEPVASRDDNSDGDNTSDEEYVDETVKKVREEVKVAKMIANAEVAARPSEANVKRATSVLKARSRKDATLQLLKKQDASASSIASTLSLLREKLTKLEELYDNGRNSPGKTVDQDSVEERLALSVSKADFARMEIIGQFNLGFILATRPAELRATQSNGPEKNKSSDELFIIDQHASDEKYNFERLQVETVVQNQRLVHAKSLDLTAVEEELILNHPEALTKNGFVVNVDQSGDKAVGRRAQLVSLPMSKEVIFDSHDLEELLALLADQAGSAVPRPSKVRRMFAMRACRSSIMVGKTLTVKQMQNVVKHMGEIDKPWNCPHGRPTMRHLIGLDSWQSWEEGSGLAGLDETVAERADWDEFIRQVRSERESEAGSEGMENAEDEGYL